MRRVLAIGLAAALLAGCPSERLLEAAAAHGSLDAIADLAKAHGAPDARPAERERALMWALLLASQADGSDEQVAALRAGLDEAAQRRAADAARDFQLAHADDLPKRFLPAELAHPDLAPRPSRTWTSVPLAAGAAPRFATQVGGAPWWPRGTARPRCPRHGTEEGFVAQVRLADVPGMGAERGLLSLHICDACAFIGHDGDDPGYAVTLLAPGAAVDGRGQAIATGPPPAVPRLAAGRDGPAPEELEALAYARAPYFDAEWFGRSAPPPGHAEPTGRGGNFSTKLGGWPGWRQHAGWPTCPEGRRMTFVAQFDDETAPDYIWGGGGCVYLFVCPPACKDRRGEAAAQFT